MKRRQFIYLLGAAVAWPVAVRGQQRNKAPTIGVLGVSTPPSNWRYWVSVFTQRLRELGWGPAPRFPMHGNQP